jgi:hypothetical protein
MFHHSFQQIVNKYNKKKNTDYYHFDQKINYLKKIENYPSFKEYYKHFTHFVEKEWRSLPFLRYVEVQDKYKYKTKQELKSGNVFQIELKNKQGETTKTVFGRRKKTTPKKRIFNYPSHLDGYVHYIYSLNLAEYYEYFLSKNNLSNNIIAYRQILVDEESQKGKSVAHFANEVFDFVENTKDYCVIISDISHFFDNINHEILKSKVLLLKQIANFNKIDKTIFSHIIANPY